MNIFNKVWVVERYSLGDYSGIDGVFSSKDKALKYVQRKNLDETNIEEFTLDEVQ